MLSLLAYYALITTLCALTLAQTKCPLSPNYERPTVADGYSLQLVANDLKTPRHIVFDNLGNLLYAGDREGIMALVLKEDDAGCVGVERKVVVAENDGLDLYHGISLSRDGGTLFASSTTTAYSWTYNSTTLTTSSRRALITGMYNPGHITRTLLSSPSNPSILLVSRGSDGNIDPGSADITTGRSQLKAFDIGALGQNASYDFNTDGVLLGWGLRNSVGVAEDSHGAIWSVENSADEIVIEGFNIHEHNPAEELNSHGLLSTALSTPGYIGPNYGYPTCLTTWDAAALPPTPPYTNLTRGAPFPIAPTDTCTTTRPAAFSFDSHNAPLDIKFHPGSGAAFITFHGSAARAQQSGYKVSYLPYTPSGEPQGPLVDVVWTVNTTRCPTECLRPVGLAFDEKGRVWYSSDRSGEMWVLTLPAAEEDGTGGDETGGGGDGQTGGSAESEQGSAAERGRRWRHVGVVVVGWAVWWVAA